MNFTSHHSLPKFYNFIFRDYYSDQLPNFLGYNVGLPIYAHSFAMSPPSSIFFDKKYIKDTGQPVIYTRSVVKLNLELGSSESIALLQSVLECKNSQIFGTSFINAYVNDKWEIVKWFMWLQFVLYFSYLIFLCVYMLHFYENKIFLTLPLATNVLLTIYEIYKAAVSKKEYLKDIWNYIDLARALLFFIYTLGVISQGPPPKVHSQRHKVDSINNVLLALTLLSFIRGISYFRLFQSTRHFTNVIYQVILDSRAFTILMVYSTVAVGFLLYIVFRFEEDYSVYLGYSFLIDVQYLDPTYFNQTQWTVYAISLTINCILMMSLLISIYYDTIYVVIERAEIDNCRALASMTLEAERNMFWKRNKAKDTYLQQCKKEYSEADSDPVSTKIKEVKTSIKEMQGQIAQVVEFRKEITKVAKDNERILKALPREKKTINSKKSRAILMLILLIKGRKTENPYLKASYVKKIS